MIIMAIKPTFFALLHPLPRARKGCGCGEAKDANNNVRTQLCDKPLSSTSLQRKAFANQVEAQQCNEGDKYNRKTMRQLLFHGARHLFVIYFGGLSTKVPARAPKAPRAAAHTSAPASTPASAPAMAAALTRRHGAARLGVNACAPCRHARQGRVCHPADHHTADSRFPPAKGQFAVCTCAVMRRAVTTKASVDMVP